MLSAWGLPLFSLFASSFLAIGAISPVSAAGPWDGEWVGKIDADAASLENCRAEISVDQANIADNTLSLSFNNYGKIREIASKIDGSGNFSSYHDLDVFVSTKVANQVKSRSFLLKGRLENKNINARFTADVAERRGGFCQINVALAQAGSIEAKALMTGEDPEILKLEAQAQGLGTTSSVISICR